MGPSSWSRDQTRVHAMETQGVPYSQNISCATTSHKVHGNSFLGSEGVLLLEFTPHKTTITGCTYASTMVALRENITQKRYGKLSAGVLLLHDNAPAHKSRTSRAAVRAQPSSLQSRPGSQWLSIQKSLKLSAWETISRWQCSQGSYNRVLCNKDVSFFFLRVFDHWRRSGLRVLQSRGLHWKIMRWISPYVIFMLRYITYWMPLVHAFSFKFATRWYCYQSFLFRTCRIFLALSSVQWFI